MPFVTVAYPPESLTGTFGETISKLGLRSCAAETEKYAHVSFSSTAATDVSLGGQAAYPSPKQFPTYDLIPEMSARELTKEVVQRILSGQYDIVVVNYANCDMVGHTGNFEATVKAVETVDECVGKVVEATSAMGGITIVTADHGNAEDMMAADGPQTAHTCDLVPFIIVGADVRLRPGGRLSDIAPTILDLLGFEKPAEMTGESLICMRP